MADTKIHIIYGTDDNYIFPTFVSAASALHYAQRPQDIVLHLFDAGVTDAHYDAYDNELKRLWPGVTTVRHVLKPEMFAGFGAWKGSVVTYSRMFMAELLPDLDWAIYVDGDTLWLGDPQLLWDLRDETQLVLASIDPPRPLGDINPEWAWYAERGLEIDGTKYLCMGLMLANLKLMRERGIPQAAREFMTKYPCPRIVDQTVLNYVCRDNTRPLPENWGVFSTWHKDVDLSQPSLVHYVSDVPWVRRKPNKLFSDVALLWFEFCRRVLGRDEMAKFPPFTRFWRRAAYNVCRHIQPVVKLNLFIHSRLRNTHGIPKAEYEKIVASMTRSKGSR